MKTAVTIPAGWAVEEGVDGRRVLRAPAWPVGAAADIGLVLYPLWQLPDPASAAIVPFAERDLPPRARARVVSTTEGRTALGAPMVLVEVNVESAEGKPVEQRLCAVYEFLEYGGGAMVRARNPERLAASRDELLAIFASGRADFTGHIAALEQLYAGLQEEGSWAQY